MIESRLRRSLSVDVLSPARDGDDERILAPRLLAKTTTRIETVDERQTEIQQDRIGAQAFRGGQRLGAIVCRVDIVTADRQQRGKRFSMVGVVVDDEDPACVGRRGEQ